MKLKFQIRDLLWLMVVVAFFMLWWREHVEVRRYQAEAERQAVQNRAVFDFMMKTQLTATQFGPWTVSTPASAGESNSIFQSLDEVELKIKINGDELELRERAEQTQP